MFLAQDTSLDPRVALKFLPEFLQEDPTVGRRMETLFHTLRMKLHTLLRSPRWSRTRLTGSTNSSARLDRSMSGAAESGERWVRKGFGCLLC